MDLDQLKLIGRKELAMHLGFVNTRSFDRWRKDNDFPKPTNMGGSLRWLVADVFRWQIDQIVQGARDTKPGTNVRARKTDS